MSEFVLLLGTIIVGLWGIVYIGCVIPLKIRAKVVHDIIALAEITLKDDDISEDEKKRRLQELSNELSLGMGIKEEKKESRS